MQLGLTPACMWERGEEGRTWALSEMTEVTLATMVSQSIRLMCQVTLKCPSFITCNIKIITLCIPYETIPCLLIFVHRDHHSAVMLSIQYLLILTGLLNNQYSLSRKQSHRYFSYLFFLESTRLPSCFGNQANCCGSISNKSLLLWHTLHCLFRRNHFCFQPELCNSRAFRMHTTARLPSGRRSQVLRQPCLWSRELPFQLSKPVTDLSISR